MGREERANEANQPSPMMSMSREDLIAILGSLKPDPEEQARVMAKAAELSRPTPPENKFPPLISARNPWGQKDHPAPPLPCKCYINDAIELEYDQESYEMCALLNIAVQHQGTYLIQKPDGSSAKFDIVVKQDDFGKLESLSLRFLCKDLSDATAYPPMTEMLRQCLKDAAKDVLTLAQMWTTRPPKQAPVVVAA